MGVGDLRQKEESERHTQLCYKPSFENTNLFHAAVVLGSDLSITAISCLLMKIFFSCKGNPRYIQTKQKTAPSMWSFEGIYQMHMHLYTPQVSTSYLSVSHTNPKLTARFQITLFPLHKTSQTATLPTPASKRQTMLDLWWCCSS